MAKRPGSRRGRDRLDDAIASLLQAQAAYDAGKVENEEIHHENERRWNELTRQSDECFAHIERQLATILEILNYQTQILSYQTQLLNELPDRICEALGYKTTP